MDKWERQNRKQIADVEKAIDRIYREAVAEAARIGASVPDYDPEKPFSFSASPAARNRVKGILNKLKSDLSVAIVNGVDSAWTLANNKNNELCRVVFGDNAGKLSEEQYRRYYTSNDKAREAFKQRKTSGLGLSDRVWNYTDQFKNELEMGIDIGLRDGLSADEMSRQLRQYLKYPDKLFRRVRDEHGVLHLSKAAKAFHPGQGVYRSSYKNARRLAATETNIAYRTSDYMRYQQLDFVVGIRVVLSGNHTILNSKGEAVPFEDICDELSAPEGSTNRKGRGCYPKDFRFTGWHPHCRCHVETILKTEAEMREDDRRIMAGLEPVSPTASKNYVGDVPQEFKKWTENNADRIAHAKSLPYFIRDNEAYFPQMRITRSARAGVNEAQAFNARIEATVPQAPKPRTRDQILATAQERHVARTPEQIRDIKERYAFHGIDSLARVWGIKYTNTKALPAQLDSDGIIERVAGGDMTKGSCSSAALAYIGNRGGMDVLDFRGGKSRYFFSLRDNIRKIAKAVGGIEAINTNGFANAHNLFAHVEQGKEYYFTSGAHAVIIRKTSTGMEYLELQDKNVLENGFKPLNDKVLKNRFGTKKSRTSYGSKCEFIDFLIDIDLLKDNAGFKKLLGYINTEPGQQMKGASGGQK